LTTTLKEQAILLDIFEKPDIQKQCFERTDNNGAKVKNEGHQRDRYSYERSARKKI